MSAVFPHGSPWRKVALKSCVLMRGLVIKLSGTDMLVDDYEKYNNDRQDVVDLNTDDTLGGTDAEPMADDCTFSLFVRLPRSCAWLSLGSWNHCRRCRSLIKKQV